MQRTLAVLKGRDAVEAIAKYPGSISAAKRLPGWRHGRRRGSAQPVGGSSSGTTYYRPSPESSGASGMLLNYLLGN